MGQRGRMPLRAMSPARTYEADVKRAERGHNGRPGYACSVGYPHALHCTPARRTRTQRIPRRTSVQVAAAHRRQRCAVCRLGRAGARDPAWAVAAPVDLGPLLRKRMAALAFEPGPALGFVDASCATDAVCVRVCGWLRVRARVCVRLRVCARAPLQSFRSVYDARMRWAMAGRLVRAPHRRIAQCSAVVSRGPHSIPTRLITRPSGRILTATSPSSVARSTHTAQHARTHSTALTHARPRARVPVIRPLGAAGLRRLPAHVHE
jgi:hypothetical protein